MGLAPALNHHESALLHPASPVLRTSLAVFLIRRLVCQEESETTCKAGYSKGLAFGCY
jgi:hypothetical protein